MKRGAVPDSVEIQRLVNVALGRVKAELVLVGGDLVNVYTGEIADMKKLNVIEPLRVGRQAISSATEAAIMILRIDDVIAAKSMPGGAPGGMPPGAGGMPGGMPPGMM